MSKARRWKAKIFLFRYLVDDMHNESRYLLPMPAHNFGIAWLVECATIFEGFIASTPCPAPLPRGTIGPDIRAYPDTVHKASQAPFQRARSMRVDNIWLLKVKYIRLFFIWSQKLKVQHPSFAFRGLRLWLGHIRVYGAA
jgi:hypothetical protein